MQKALAGRKIASVAVRFAGRLNVSAREFVRRVEGARIASVGRRAKLLLVNLSNGETIVTHLKMTGKYLLKPAGTEPTKHSHVVFDLDDGERLLFEDIRKFGYLKLIKTAALEKEVFDKEGYGPEPLDPAFTSARFALCLRGGGAQRIKPRLMAQTCIAGIGNIYADESLWRARIKPDRRVSTLKDAEIAALHDGVQVSLRESLKNRGTSADNFADLYGRPGKNVAKLKVYGREGMACQRCGAPIKKKRFAGRGTHWCGACQK
jgi:formamidopyrimidine-DNA glycosylase